MAPDSKLSGVEQGLRIQLLQVRGLVHAPASQLTHCSPLPSFRLFILHSVAKGICLNLTLSCDFPAWNPPWFPSTQEKCKLLTEA